ncbi:DUF6702 family protein [Colwellia psychrerythraea]|uniref:Orphan protein n=1 Tax=Colwellia psychrerythraea (strain 34H / ATCC BAA-681) TaxID=167879 RepID=Q489U6_COLP3|nr:DUF6702 family protein [Colwellia psychrerythraea]AAZ24098.1 hypothetical protein CPS_0410 [Colwellia psychrerythraea 34H]
MSKVFSKYLIAIGFYIGLVASATSHTYFFGVSDVSINPKTKHLEIIHQFTTHDIENAIAEKKQVHFSAEHKNYDVYIQQFFEQQFSLEKNQMKIPLIWLGFEVTSGKIIAYQESSQRNLLPQTVVKNAILIDTYPKQVNTVNFQGVNVKGEALFGSLTFDYRIKEAIITSDTSQ